MNKFFAGLLFTLVVATLSFAHEEPGNSYAYNDKNDFPTNEPRPEQFSFSTNSNLTQWQFQVILPEFNVSEYKTWEDKINTLFKNYASANKTLGDLKIKDKYSTVGNMSYWHFPKPTHLFGARASLVKATYLYYGEGAGTSHLVTKFRSLPSFASGKMFNGTAVAGELYQKFDNEIHCKYYDNSRSVEVRNLLEPQFDISNVGDLEKWYGPDFVDFLGISANTSLPAHRGRTVISTNWDMEFKVDNAAGQKVHVKVGATLSQEVEPEDPSKPSNCELDVKINRHDVTGDDPVLLWNGLQSLKDLSEFLVATEVGVASCKCLMPGGMLGCVTGAPDRRRGAMRFDSTLKEQQRRNRKP